MNSLPKRIVGNRILVLPDKPVEKTHGGIIIPQTANAAVEQGTVVMVSEHILHIAPGDQIVYPAGAGIPHEYEGKTYKYLDGPVKDRTGDVIAII